MLIAIVGRPGSEGWTFRAMYADGSVKDGILYADTESEAREQLEMLVRQHRGWYPDHIIDRNEHLSWTLAAFAQR